MSGILKPKVPKPDEGLIAAQKRQASLLERKERKEKAEASARTRLQNAQSGRRKSLLVASGLTRKLGGGA